MEDWIKVSAKTVDDAVTQASIQLGTSRDHMEYRVIEHETKGFLGLGAKPAVIEARAKQEEEDIVKEVFSAEPVKTVKEKPAAKPAAKAVEKPVEKQAEKPAAKPAAEKKKAQQPKKEKKTETAEKPKKANAPAVKKEAAKPAEAKERAPRVPADPEEAINRAETFLKDMFEAMGMKVDLSSSFEDDTLSIELAGDDMGVLIGKRGQTLDSIQYLTSLVVNKSKASYVRVKVDTEDYRSRRRATLENLAKNIAFKVKKTGRPVYLEPMNPYERRIIHSALQNDPYVTTHSEGEEPNRKVVVTLRKREREIEEQDS